MHRLLPALLLLSACPPPTEPDDDATTDDDSVVDDDTSDDDSVVDDDSAGDDDAVVPDWSHCPPASDWVGDASWSGTLSVAEDTLWCGYPRMWTELGDIVGSKQMLRLVPGAFGMPLLATAEAFRLPACLWSPQWGQQAVDAGTVDASVWSGFDGEYTAVTGRFPAEGGGTVELLVRVAPGENTAQLAGTDAFDAAGGGARCQGETCWEAEDTILAPCSPPANVCDHLEFDRGWISIDTHHWAGSVGAGFATMLRARGVIDGVAFDIDDYWSLDQSYGHHAFSRGALVRFPSPVGGACALRLAEVSEFASDLGPFELLDCDGAVLGSLDLLTQEHTWGEGACADDP
jgi:hypothetical protein